MHNKFKVNYFNSSMI